MRVIMLKLFLVLAMFTGSAAAQAEVIATFYTRNFGSYFPHTFVKFDGTVEETGEKLDTNIGFTAVSVSPGILFGSVKGHIHAASPKYVASSEPHFSMKLTDEKYKEFLALAKKWQDIPGKSYNLKRRNCVHFIAEAMGLVGLKTNPKSKFLRKPIRFMQETMALNPDVEFAIDRSVIPEKPSKKKSKKNK